MNTDTNDTPESRDRPGIIERLKSQAASIIGTSRTRIDTFSADVEERIFRFLLLLVLRLVAFVALTIGFFMAMLTVMFGFDLPPKYSLGIPAVTFLLIGAVAVAVVKFKQRAKPHRR